jgi:hypothetical protein
LIAQPKYASDPRLLSRRSFVRTRAGRLAAAAEDARLALSLCSTDSDRANALLYLGEALLAQCENARARDTLRECAELMLPSEDVHVSRLLSQSENAVAAETSRRRAAGIERAARLRNKRSQLRNAQREALRKQSISSPSWSTTQFEWRPTFVPQLRSQHDASNLQLASDSDLRKQLTVELFQRAYELQAPREALSCFYDINRLQCFTRAASLTCENAEVLSLSSGGGFLPCISAQFAAKRVAAFEQNAKLARLTAVLRDDAVRNYVIAPDVIGGEDACADPDLIFIDRFDHTCLGLNALGALQRMAARNTSRKEPMIVPRAAIIFVKLVEVRTESVEGFDMSRTNVFRWHPTAKRIKSLDKLRLSCSSFELLSDWIKLHEINFADFLTVRFPNATLERHLYQCITANFRACVRNLGSTTHEPMAHG